MSDYSSTIMTSLKKAASVVLTGPRPGSRGDLIIRRFKSNKLAVAGAFLTLFFVVLALVGPFIVPYDPGAIDVTNRYAAPSVDHPFGTDELGRDVFTRVVIGARISLRIAALSITFASIAGVTLGMIAGYYGGKIDEFVMRTQDLLFAFPHILLALLIISILGPGIDKAIIALAIVFTPGMARITRGSALSVREEEYVMAAEAYGESAFGIMFREMLPNQISAVMVQATISFAFAILAEASLSFVGLSAQPPTPTWGVIISMGRDFIARAPWITVFPGLSIMLTVLGLTFLGVGLRDALDPKTDVDTTPGQN